ncbi:urease accessory protein ureD [Salinisphaera orenii MK-B5]|uniref:Urease accessory protein UreD n=1 Tax=Salinisphaera orenii MK-B5 TaxID=856730 RepID=A0A423PF37_9GAMM|nr:urease accessory protein ureD [Salinisphaera orenii MK-B5]
MLNASSAVRPLQCDIGFSARRRGTTYVGRQNVAYPFHLGRQLQLSGDPPGMAAVYLQSCSGGIFAGEALGLCLTAAAGSHAHVSTGAATVAHSMLEADALQTVRLDAHDSAYLEYLPKPTLMFPRARLTSLIEVTHRPGACVVVSDSFGVHVPDGMNGSFDWYRASIDVRTPAGRLLVSDRMFVEGDDFESDVIGVMRDRTVLSTLMIVTDGPIIDSLSEALRGALPIEPEGSWGVSRLPNACGLVVRLAARDATILSRLTHRVWATVRRLRFGVEPAARRH